MKIFKQEGPLAFYKGFIPNIARVGGFNMTLFLTIETIKRKLQLWNVEIGSQKVFQLYDTETSSTQEPDIEKLL